MKKERIISIVLITLLVWFGFTIVRLESYHYASQVGLCDEYSGLENLLQKDKCLNEQETRTNPIWHLFFGLKIL